MKLQAGDIIFEDSDRLGAKIVKFLMTAPSIWHHIYRAIEGTQETVEYYHPTLVISETEMIEQQWKVQIAYNENINKKKYIVFRPHFTNIYSKQETNDYVNSICLIQNAKEDLGQKWGIIHTLFGRFPTWLTGIPYFARYIKLPNEEVSAGRVARWLYLTYGDTFGHKKYTEATTHTMVKWMLNHPELYEVIEKVG